MDHLMEKIDSLEKHLSHAGVSMATIIASNAHGHSEQDHKVPDWAADLSEQLHKMSTELKSVKEEIGRSFPQSRSPGCLDSSRLSSEADLQHNIPPKPLTHKKRQEVATKATKPPSAPARPPQHVVQHELLLQPPNSTTLLQTRSQDDRHATDCTFEKRQVQVQGNASAHCKSDLAGTKRRALPNQPQRNESSQSKKPKIAPEIDSLFQAVCGKTAFCHLCSLIGSWRTRWQPLFEIDKSQAPVYLVNVIDRLERGLPLNDFLRHFTKVKFSEVIDNRKAEVSRIRADPEAIKTLIKGLGWEYTKKNRAKLHHYLAEGRQWKKIVGNFDGLLGLIPAGGPLISGNAYLELSDELIKAFHTYLNSNEFFKLLCQMGRSFQESIWSNMEVPEFRWESEDMQRISRLSIRQLAPFTEKFTTITVNAWDPDKYDWLKLDVWPWSWPQAPDWIHPSDVQCGQCSEGKCDCITRCFPQNHPLITNEGSKGQGLRVFGETYRKGQFIDQLLGEFAPLETHHDGWATEFCRPDLDNEPVALIYSRDQGNYIRKVNHSCNPSAKFCEEKISGRWRLVLIAIEDIPHNSEITIDCGKGFLVGQGKECFCNVCLDNGLDGLKS